MKYYIYHIKGRKIGCSMDIKRPLKQLRENEEYEILSSFNCIVTASIVEQMAQATFGYKIDQLSYHIANSVEANKKKSESLKGLKRPKSAEHRKNHSESLKGFKHTEKTKAKMKRKKYPCQYCTREIGGTTNLKRHEKSCKEV